MTPTKIALAGAAMTVLLIMFATRPAPAPDLPLDPVVRAIPTETLAQMPFDHPSWEPNEDTKTWALKRGYELNGNRMCCGSIDVSQEVAERNAGVVSPDEKNALDDEAGNAEDHEARRRFMHRVFKATRDQLAKAEVKQDADICKRHGLHKVVYGDKWRCRK